MRQGTLAFIFKFPWAASPNLYSCLRPGLASASHIHTGRPATQTRRNQSFTDGFVRQVPARHPGTAHDAISETPPGLRSLGESYSSTVTHQATRWAIERSTVPGLLLVILHSDGPYRMGPSLHPAVQPLSIVPIALLWKILRDRNSTPIRDTVIADAEFWIPGTQFRNPVLLCQSEIRETGS